MTQPTQREENPPQERLPESTAPIARGLASCCCHRPDQSADSPTLEKVRSLFSTFSPPATHLTTPFLEFWPKFLAFSGRAAYPGHTNWITIARHYAQEHRDNKPISSAESAAVSKPTSTDVRLPHPRLPVTRQPGTVDSEPQTNSTPGTDSQPAATEATTRLTHAISQAGNVPPVTQGQDSLPAQSKSSTGSQEGRS